MPLPRAITDCSSCFWQTDCLSQWSGFTLHVERISSALIFCLKISGIIPLSIQFNGYQESELHIITTKRITDGIFENSTLYIFWAHYVPQAMELQLIGILNPQRARIPPEGAFSVRNPKQALFSYRQPCKEDRNHQMFLLRMKQMSYSRWVKHFMVMKYLNT